MVVIINAEHNQTSWDPSLLVFRTSRQLDFCLLAGQPAWLGGAGKSDDRREAVKLTFPATGMERKYFILFNNLKQKVNGHLANAFLTEKNNIFSFNTSFFTYHINKKYLKPYQDRATVSLLVEI